jgi:putative ABC transport system substrate-binding protein
LSRVSAVIDRRGLLSVMLAVVAFPAAAQETKKPRRIGILLNTTVQQAMPFLRPFIDELQRLGYAEGRDIVFECAQAEGRPERHAVIAADIVGRRVDVIYAAGGSELAAAAKAATREIPIVVIGGDLVELGLVASFARPGGNVTGIDASGSENAVKQIEWLKRLIPALSRVAVLGPRVTRFGARASPLVKAAAEQLGLSFRDYRIDQVSELESVFVEMRKSRIEAVLVAGNTMFLPELSRVARLAINHRIAASFYWTWGAEAGGLLAYDTDGGHLTRRAASFVDRILKGAAPADLPVEFATHFKLTINLKTAKALGIEIPETILNLADRVIE